MFPIETFSPQETRSVGASLGRLCRPGDIVLLNGELGAGKTEFAKGVAEGLGVDPTVPVTSPTYTLLNEYGGGRLPLFHFDLYRLPPGEAGDLGFDEYLHDAGVSLVEWGERLDPEVPDDHLLVVLSVVSENRRSLAFSGSGPASRKLLEELAAELKNVLTVHSFPAKE